MFQFVVPEINLAVPRLGCSLIKGQSGNYPFFFVDNGDSLNVVEQPRQASSRHRHRHNQSRSVWDASSDWQVSSSRPFDREVHLRSRGDALANASAWGFMDNVAISTSAVGMSFIIKSGLSITDCLECPLISAYLTL